MISRFFIERPVFATVLSIAITLAGLVAIRALPIAQYPNILPPEVVVSARYSGASAQVIAESIAAPLEQQINGAENMIYLRSTSADSGTMQLSVSFAIGTDPDQATIDVNNRVQAALPNLPAEVRQQGVLVKKRSTSILAVVTLASPDGRYDPVFISNYALLNIIDELKRTPGVGDAALFGAKDYSMRIWLQPDKLAQHGLTPGDVADAIREQNAQFAAGKFGAEPNINPLAFTYTVTTQGRFVEPAQFEEIILSANSDGSALRLKDVARVELGAKDYGFSATFNGQPAVPIGLYLQPGANALDTIAAVEGKLEEMAQRFPQGLSYSIPFNTTKFVESSIDEVVKTLIEALLLVVAVVYLFLQNTRATLIPLLAVPVSLIGTFAGMYLLGFSINLLTLFGLVLAIGIVVDDAIVVLENVERIMAEEGLPPKAAALKAMEEVTGPVISIVLVLCAVFVPVAFLGGLAGQMYKQFAITIAISVVISGIVALTLTPALCALLLKPGHQQPPAPLRRFNAWFESLTAGYTAGVRLLLRRGALGALLFLGMVAITAVLLERLPGALVPEEDQGYLFTLSELPPAAALGRTRAVADELTAKIGAEAPVADIVSFAGFDLTSQAQRTNFATQFVMLKDWGQRDLASQSALDMKATISGQLGPTVPAALVKAFTPPPITGISSTGGFEAYLQSRTGDPTALAGAVEKVLAEAAKRPELIDMKTTLKTRIPSYDVVVDREKAKALNVPINSVFDAMQSTFGSLYVNDFTLYGRNYQVNLQSEANFREKPEDLSAVYVRAAGGEMIPLTALVDIKRGSGPDLVDRFNVFPAAKILGNPAPGYSSGQAIAALEDVIAQTLDGNFQLGWVGAAYQEKETSGTSQLAFVFGIIMVLLILAAQYERWSLPFAIVLAVPFAMFGAALAVWMRGLYNDVYFQIGLLVLIGLAAKNAILIVEFAVLKRAEGLSAAEAAIAAAKLRFRPIVMTSLAFILGCVPLAISTGAGAASRHSIGTGVIGGMLGATVLAIFFVPLFYRWIDGAGQLFSRRKATLASQAPAPYTAAERGPTDRDPAAD